MINFTPGSTYEVMTATPFLKLSIHSSDIQKTSAKFLLLFLIVTIATSGVFAVGRSTSSVSFFKAESFINLSAPADGLRDNSIIV